MITELLPPTTEKSPIHILLVDTSQFPIFKYPILVEGTISNDACGCLVPIPN